MHEIVPEAGWRLDKAEDSRTNDKLGGSVVASIVV
jgi:hypothetical protein